MGKLDFLQLSSWGWLMMMLYWLYAGMKTKMTIRKQNNLSRWIHLFLVITAFALIYKEGLGVGFLKVRLYPVNIYLNILGLVINLAGIIFAITARSWLGTNWSATVTVKVNHDLIMGGPYSHLRHPIYTGILFGMIGAIIILGEIRGLVALGLFLTAMGIKMTKEEEFMKSTFPSYQDYMKKTKKLIPFVY
jgi:protein-S-isoprenylcysteine O-methyltransferase